MSLRYGGTNLSVASTETVRAALQGCDEVYKKCLEVGKKLYKIKLDEDAMRTVRSDSPSPLAMFDNLRT